MDFTKNLNEAEEFDKLKSKVLKYVIYKKRTEQEVRNKFKDDIDENQLEDIIEILKENNYINDLNYIERSIAEYMALNELSIKEIKYKLLQKGVDRKLLENYILEHNDELEEFELNSAIKLIQKKSRNMENDKIEQYLYSKGYMSNTIEKSLKST